MKEWTKLGATFVDIVAHHKEACRERGEARDALADLLLALDDPGPHRAILRYTPALVAAMQQARTVLRKEEGAEGNAIAARARELLPTFRCQCGRATNEPHRTAGLPFVQCSRRVTEPGHDSLRLPDGGLGRAVLLLLLQEDGPC